MDLFLSLAVYIILWWLCFFAMLPIGVKNLDEAGEARGIGQERAAPAHPNLGKKALWAAGAAAAVWILVYAAVETDLFGVRAGLGG